MAYLGLDLGTSGLRALLTGEAGEVLASVERGYEVAYPHPGWAEQDPADWITALNAVIAELKDHPQFSSVRGIAVAGHMHGAVLLDAKGELIRPCILWNDTRAHAEAARLDGINGVRDLSGNIVFPGFTAPKLDWVRHHEPEQFARVAKVVLPAGYLNTYLTGEAVADMSDSAGTSWLDVGLRDWSDTLLSVGHMRRDQMPALVEGCEAAGLLRPELAVAWGLSGEVVVAGGAGDNAAAACGMGVLSEGQGFVSLGTSGVLLVARDGYHPAPETALHTFCHAVPERWYQMGVMLSATASLNWLSRITDRTPAELTTALGDDLAAPSEVGFLPYLQGERTPHNDADIRGGFFGLSSGSSRADLTRAVLEGVAFGLRDCAEAARGAGASFERLFAIGGGAASTYWLSLIATVLNVPLVKPAGGEFGAALGAARLARMAVTEESVEDVMRVPETGEVIAPVEALVAPYEASYRRYRAAYPAFKAIEGQG